MIWDVVLWVLRAVGETVVGLTVLVLLFVGFVEYCNRKKPGDPTVPLGSE
jgi:hypothetical protein